MNSVYEFLRDRGFDAHLNPRGAEMSRFTIRGKSVIVRPRVTTQPAEGLFVSIEGILVELFVESRALDLMDAVEYEQIFRNATGGGRISMARLTDYAGQRKTAARDLLKSIKKEYS